MEPTRIQQLTDNVIDQIAAGEVIERPSHLVKELLENSFDAGATSVTIDVAEGGRFVRVTDNGYGIHQEDLALILKRHTTSKIREAADLWTLNSFGFRGEALSSIAAVSRMKVISRRRGHDRAFQVESQFGASEITDQVSHDEGTTVEIASLFENLPARLKFLKSPQAETTAIRAIIKSLALINPGVEFRFRVNGALDLFYPIADSFFQRSQAVLEEDKLIYKSASKDGMSLEITFSDPHLIQKTSKSMWFFVQGRAVQDRSLQAAIIEAYRGTLMHGEFPMAVVSLRVPPDEVDVNIHPSKSQVKFLKASNIFSFLYHNLRAGLEDHLQPRNQLRPNPAGLGESSEASVRGDVGSSQPLRFDSFELDRVQYQQKDIPAAQGINLSDHQDFAYQREAPSSRPPNFAPTANTLKAEAEAPPKQGAWSRLQVLAQAHLTYIICQGDEGLCLIDQHAAHERVLFESLSQGWARGEIASQGLLFPLAIDLTSEHLEALDLVKESFQRMSLVWEVLGPQTIGIVETPSLVKESALPALLKKVAEDIIERGGSFEFEKAAHDIFSTMACHSAIRAGQALSLPEMVALLKEMDEFAFSQFCPHGRPVSVRWSVPELEREFGRRPS